MRCLAIHVLTVLALVTQYQSLRACALEEWLLGSNCHDEDAALIAAGAAAAWSSSSHEPHPAHDPCICEVPKNPTERQQRIVATDVLLVSIIAVQRPVNSPAALRAHRLAPAHVATTPPSLPLLL